MFSVIIRCRNEDRWVGYAIQSVLDHLSSPQIIVVDNSSTDDSVEIISMFERYNVTKINVGEDYSPGKSLNLGAQESKLDNILVLSAHCVIRKFDEVAIKNLLEDNECVFGNQVPVFRGKTLLKKYIWSHFGDSRVVNMWSDTEGRYFLHNAFAAYRRDILERYPFDPKYFSKEDRYWARRVIEDGHSICYEPDDMQCFHHWTPNGATWRQIG